MSRYYFPLHTSMDARANKQNLNQKLWQRLEAVEMDYFTQRFGHIWSITGPLSDDPPSHVKSGAKVPDALYKIFAIPGKNPRLLAFIIPQGIHDSEPLDQSLTPTDEIRQHIPSAGR